MLHADIGDIEQTFSARSLINMGPTSLSPEDSRSLLNYLLRVIKSGLK